jgi:NAD(P)H-flavin reductase
MLVILCRWPWSLIPGPWHASASQDLAARNRNFHLWFTVDEAKAGWPYSTGFVTKQMCEEHLPAASKDTLVFLCGPPPMIKFACLPALQELGHDLRNIIEF